MKYSTKIKVYYSDTDAYGVVWHGAYIKWLEQGRVEYLALAGLSTKELEMNGYTFPVVDLSCKYKSPAKNFDELLVETEIEKLSKLSITFSHKITRISDGQTIITATSTVVAIDKDGKLYRRLPEFIYEVLESSMQKDLPVHI
jgi:acyl-CoA thioester hydrolase